MANNLLDDGTVPLTKDWNAGAFNISSTKDATADTHLTPLKNVKSAITTATAGLVKADGTVAFTGDVNVGNKKIINVANPTADTDVANKAYVDSKVSGGGSSSLSIGTIVEAFSPYDSKGATIKSINDGSALLCDGSKIKVDDYPELADYFVNVLGGDFNLIEKSPLDGEEFVLPNIPGVVTNLGLYNYKLYKYIVVK